MVTITYTAACLEEHPDTHFGQLGVLLELRREHTGQLRTLVTVNGDLIIRGGAFMIVALASKLSED